MRNPMWRCRDCGSTSVQISLRAWFLEDESGALKYVDADVEGNVLAWACTTCGASDTGNAERAQPDIWLPHDTSLMFIDANSGLVDWCGPANDALESNVEADDVCVAIRNVLRTGQPAHICGGATPRVEVRVLWSHELIASLPLFYVINRDGILLKSEAQGEQLMRRIRVPEWVILTTNSPGYDANSEVELFAQNLGYCPLRDEFSLLSIDKLDNPETVEETAPKGADQLSAAAALANKGFCLIKLPDWMPKDAGTPNPLCPRETLRLLEGGTPPFRIYPVESRT